MSGTIRLNGSTSGYVELTAPAVAGSTSLELPLDSLQPGLVHLHTETFSAASSVSIDNVFSSTYDDYRVMMRYSASVSSDLYFRYRSGGADSTNATQNNRGFIDPNSVAVQNFSHVDQNYLRINNSATVGNAITIDIQSPYDSSQYTFGTYMAQQNHFATSAKFAVGSATILTALQHDGFTVYPASGNITGTLRIYGYRNN